MIYYWIIYYIKGFVYAKLKVFLYCYSIISNIKKYFYNFSVYFVIHRQNKTVTQKWRFELNHGVYASLNISLCLILQDLLILQMVLFFSSFFFLFLLSGKWWIPTTGKDGSPTTPTGSSAKTPASSTWNPLWTCGSTRTAIAADERHLCTTRGRDGTPACEMSVCMDMTDWAASDPAEVLKAELLKLGCRGNGRSTPM